MSISEGTNSTHRPNSIHYRSIALPAEHGGWGFLLEAILLGLLVAFSWQGVVLAFTMLAVFLMHQPSKIAIKDHRRGRRSPRTLWAERFILFYGLLALAGFGVLLITADTAFLVPLALATPFVLVQFWFDAQNQSRSVIAELSGAIALGAIAASIAVAGGWLLLPALALWFLLGLRSVLSIVYVRARLRIQREQKGSIRAVYLAYILGLAIVITLNVAALVPPLAIGAVFILFLRAMWGFTFKTPATTRQIGILEMVIGIIYVVMITAGYLLAGL